MEKPKMKSSLAITFDRYSRGSPNDSWSIGFQTEDGDLVAQLKEFGHVSLWSDGSKGLKWDNGVLSVNCNYDYDEVLQYIKRLGKLPPRGWKMTPEPKCAVVIQHVYDNKYQRLIIFQTRDKEAPKKFAEFGKITENYYENGFTYKLDVFRGYCMDEVVQYMEQWPSGVYGQPRMPEQEGSEDKYTVRDPDYCILGNSYLWPCYDCRRAHSECPFRYSKGMRGAFACQFKK